MLHPMSLITLLAQAEAEAKESIVERFQLTDTISQTPVKAWLILLGGIFGGMVAGKVISSVMKNLGQSARAKGWEYRGVFLTSFAGPLNLALIGLGCAIGLSNVVLTDDLQRYVGRALLLIYLFSLAWLVYNLVDLADAGLRRLTAKTESKLDDQLVPLVRKSLRVFVVIVFSLFIAENVFGANIGTWLAGLGIAGLAVSLAAQDSIKNVFGSLTILLDQPFQQGDLIKMGSMMGTVEEIGFRSTRVRTPEGSLVTVPNSKLSDSEVDNLTRRKTIRRLLNVSVTYDTPIAKMEEAVQIIREIFADPEIAVGFDPAGNPPRAYFDELNSDNLNIRVMYWFQPVDYWAYLEHAQRFNMKLMRRFEEAGIEFAFPTRTLMLAGDPKRQIEIGVRQLSGGDA